MKQNPMLLTDFYKTVHEKAYAPGLTKLYSYWTPRMSRKEGMNEVVMFGLQSFIKEYLIEYFDDNFFNRDIKELEDEYVEVITNTMGEDYADFEPIKKLWNLQYLPIQISAVPEGTLVPIKVPMLEITNTHNDFAWLVNYLETYMSCNIWQPMTSATIAHSFRKIINKYYDITCDNTDRRDKACGDFSMRGFSSINSALASSSGHLTSFSSTATIGVYNYLKEYYFANPNNITSATPSTEHSVMCTYGKDEYEAYKHLITEVFPNGPISIVSDTYDYWNILTSTLPSLKKEIMNRNGKVIIRGDSGDPIDIICGTVYDYIEVKDLNDEDELNKILLNKYIDNLLNDNIFKSKLMEVVIKNNNNYYSLCGSIIVTDRGKFYLGKIDINYLKNNPEMKGTVELLWETFGGYINSKGYKVLDPHVGAIYGDGITLERCEEICKRLEMKGFAASNCIFGIGSFTYQYNTRDTFGFALKATHAIINNEEKFIFKDPITDKDKFKKSQKGRCLVKIDNINEDITYVDGYYNKDIDKEKENNLLKPVFKNGKMLKEYTLEEIRNKINGGKF